MPLSVIAVRYPIHEKNNEVSGYIVARFGGMDVVVDYVVVVVVAVFTPTNCFASVLLPTTTAADS